MNAEQSKKAIELLREASEVVGQVSFDEGNEDDDPENDLEGDINKFLDGLNLPQTNPIRITIGKKNCLNDLPILINDRLDEIRTVLHNTLDKKDFDSMKSVTERLLRVAKDLDDMANEMADITKKKKK